MRWFRLLRICQLFLTAHALSGCAGLTPPSIPDPAARSAATTIPWRTSTPTAVPPPTETATPTATTATTPTATAPVLTATVFNGGNVRSIPSVQGSQVLDQVHAHEIVQLRSRTPDGLWYAITNARGVAGWVSVTLLTIDPATSAQVAVAGAAPPPTVTPTSVLGALPPSLPIARLVPFTHEDTGIVGLRPATWTLVSGTDGFEISSGPQAPDTFVGTLVRSEQLGAEGAGGITRPLFARLKRNLVEGPPPEVVIEEIGSDGSGVLLVHSTGTDRSGTLPLRVTTYARTSNTRAGVLIAFVTVPAELFPEQETQIRQMVDSLAIR